MEKVLSNAQMRLADAFTIHEKCISSAELMHRAGVAIADEAESAVKALKNDEILVVCGTGNNGGDGYVCAEELRRRGFNVAVYPLEGKLSADCQREKLAYKGRYSQHIAGAIVIDCIFGTGLDRNVAGEIYSLIEEINSSGAYVISADIPSGLSGDNGKVMGISVNANKTVAIAEYKSGHFLNDGLDVCGEVIKKDIGIFVPGGNYAEIYDDNDLSGFYPKRKRNSHKGTYGTANLIAGSNKYMGAAALSLQSALQSGCGIVKLTTDNEVKLALVAKYPQAIYSEEVDLSANAIAVGMGCGVTTELYDKIKILLKDYSGTLVIDADGLNALSKYGVEILKDKKCKVVLTPHLKEFSRLTNLSVVEISNNPISCAKSFANEYGITLVLKSASTIITDGDKTVINTRGSTALSKGGSGDILSGFLCGTFARGLEPFEAAVCTSYTLGMSAEISSEEKTDFCATAYDIIKNLHVAVKRLTRKT